MDNLNKEKSCAITTFTQGMPQDHFTISYTCKQRVKEEASNLLSYTKGGKRGYHEGSMFKAIKGVLGKFKGVMPPELPKKLPLRKEKITRLG